MTTFSDIAKFAAADFRYGVTVLSGFVLGLLLLFLKELPSFAREIVVPALIVYTIGTALIGHVQILLTASENTKRQAANERPRGIKESHLTGIIVVHVAWFSALILFLALRALA